MSRFLGEYLIGCQYPTSNMPMRFRVGLEDIDDDMSDDEIREIYQQACEEHFLQNVSCDYQKETAFVEWVRAQLSTQIEVKK